MGFALTLRLWDGEIEPMEAIMFQKKKNQNLSFLLHAPLVK